MAWRSVADSKVNIGSKKRDYSLVVAVKLNTEAVFIDANDEMLLHFGKPRCPSLSIEAFLRGGSASLAQHPGQCIANLQEREAASSALTCADRRLWCHQNLIVHETFTSRCLPIQLLSWP